MNISLHTLGLLSLQFGVNNTLIGNTVTLDISILTVENAR